MSRREPEGYAESNVVIVDDVSANVELLQVMLEPIGIGNVQSFIDPHEALAACRASPPDLVLLDLHMPRLDGLSFMAALRRVLPAGAFVPVLVMTADATVETKLAALSAGAKDFLAKPFDRVEVVLRVRNLLETASLYRRLQRHARQLELAVEEQATRQRRAEAERTERLQRVESVLAGNALSLVFQPIVDVRTGAPVGAEALARFASDPRRTPDEWFAEATAVDRGLDLELRAVTLALAELEHLPPEVFLSINVSPATLMSAHLRVTLAAVSGERIVLELTEHTRVDDYPRLDDAITGLRGWGVRIAVDDTGAGYAGLQHVLRLSPDLLKIDHALIHGIDEDAACRALVTGLLRFADEIGAMVVAEGVEAESELAVLTDLGVGWAQGYYLAAPAPLPLPPIEPASR